MARSSLLIAAAVLLIAPAAFAQDEKPAEIDNVPVTGSRIVRQDFEAISPVTQLGSEQVEIADFMGEPAYITGSRLPSRDGESLAPTLVIYGDELELSGGLPW